MKKDNAVIDDYSYELGSNTLIQKLKLSKELSKDFNEEIYVSNQISVNDYITKISNEN